MFSHFLIAGTHTHRTATPVHTQVNSAHSDDINYTQVNSTAINMYTHSELEKVVDFF